MQPPFDLSLNDKSAVVIDFGHIYSKIGFAGEAYPRFIIPTPKSLLLEESNEIEKREFLTDFLRHVYYKLLLVNPKERILVCVENISMVSSFRLLIADIMFRKFDLPSILFAPSHLMSLMTLGISSALTVECGYKETLILPVFSGFTVLNAWELAPLGAKRIHENLHDLLISHATVIDFEKGPTPLNSMPDEKLDESIIEDIKVKTCFISPLQRSLEWQNWCDKTECGVLDDGPPMPRLAEISFKYNFSEKGVGKCLEIPSRLREQACEVLFAADADGITIPSMILSSLQRTPIDTRRILAENIVLLGGTALLPGFKARLKEELNHLVANEPRFASLRGLRESFKFHSPPAKANCTCWLGGAMFGAMEILSQRALDRDTYLERPHVPDWTSCAEQSLLSQQEDPSLTGSDIRDTRQLR